MFNFFKKSTPHVDVCRDQDIVADYSRQESFEEHRSMEVEKQVEALKELHTKNNTPCGHEVISITRYYNVYNIDAPCPPCGKKSVCLICGHTTMEGKEGNYSETQCDWDNEKIRTTSFGDWAKR
jgi:hypothetical protein